MNDVLARLPRVGLANRLLVWASATVCGKKLRAPVATRGWGHLHLGPILRGESSYRFYANQIHTPGGYVRSMRNHCLAAIGKRDILRNVPLNEVDPNSSDRPTTYVYDRVPHFSDYFAGLRGHEAYLRDALWTIVSESVRTSAMREPAPEIALHIRRGDFITINRDLSSIDYFCESLDRIRDSIGHTANARVFTDGSPRALQTLLQRSNVAMHQRIGDMADLLLMSRSRYIVTSLHSTFGYFAGFLSSATVVLDPRHGESRIRSSESGLHEGPPESIG